MKQQFIILGILIFLCGCKTSHIISTGTYIKSDKRGNKEELILNEDSSFIFYNVSYIPDVSRFFTTSFDGKWSYMDNNTIFLQGTKHPWSIQITRGYVTHRERVVKVINNKKLKFPVYINGKEKYVILKKVEYTDVDD